ncbi:MAG: RNA chaperone Hfq [Acidobacteriota bacterium]
MSQATPGDNLQDDLFSQAKRDGKIVTIYLLGGVKLSGRVKGFDRFTLLLESKDHEQLIYKHAISTVSFARPEPRRGEGERRQVREEVRPAAPEAGPA